MHLFRTFQLLTIQYYLFNVCRIYRMSQYKNLELHCSIMLLQVLVCYIPLTFSFKCFLISTENFFIHRLFVSVLLNFQIFRYLGISVILLLLICTYTYTYTYMV